MQERNTEHPEGSSLFFQQCVGSGVRDQTLHRRLQRPALKHANLRLDYITQELNY